MTTPTEPIHLETRLIHPGDAHTPVVGATVPPIHLSSAFAYEKAADLEAVFAGREAGYVYSRIANPTVVQLERRMAELEGGLGAMACASGMAAISATVLTLAGAGAEIVAGNSLFGGTYSLLHQTLARYGIQTHFVEATDVDAYRRAINDRTRLVFIEVIGNPKLDVPDLAAISALARERGVVLVVDSTAASPYLVQPKTLGADIVIHSTSKFISGQGQAIGGVIIDAGTFDWASPRYPHLATLHKRAKKMAFLAYLRNQIVRDIGGCLAPFNAFLTSLGIETLAVRMERHCANALRLAEYLATDSRVVAVRYPGLASHADRTVAARQFAGRFGALLTVRLYDKAQCFRFIDALQRIRNLANIGDVRTLVIHPASTICRDLSDEGRQAVGVTDDLVRISVGIEHVDDLIGDCAQALRQA